MPIIRYLAITLISVISTFQLVMVVRAICSWFPKIRATKFFRILYVITDPVIAPMRNLLFKISFIRRLPIDLSFLATYLFLELVITFLTYVI